MINNYKSDAEVLQGSNLKGSSIFDSKIDPKFSVDSMNSTKFKKNYEKKEKNYN